MITVQDFTTAHIEEAERLALRNYNEARLAVPALPPMERTPDLQPFAENGLGTAAFEDDRLVGFLCCYDPWDGAFDSAAIGTYVPIHAHGAVPENRGPIYQRLYEAAAEKWVERKITYHAIGLYAHDNEAIRALFQYGFGLRCIDAVRPMKPMSQGGYPGISFGELKKTEEVQIRELRRLLSEHMGSSPCFMYSSPADFARWLAGVESGNSRAFAARQGGTTVAYLEVRQEGENFVTRVPSMMNLCGAFCLPELRGTGVMQGLLDCALSVLKAEGYETLGVDFESFNPTAYRFWTKYFTPYTNSVVRRIDECALQG